jgi:hypothetical protein
MTADELRERAGHYRELAEGITDERARRAALSLAIEYERQADAADGRGAATDGYTEGLAATLAALP